MILEIVYGLLAVAALLLGVGTIWMIHYRSEFQKLTKYVLKVEADRIKLTELLEAAEELAQHRKETIDRQLDLIMSNEAIPKPVKVAVSMVKHR